MITSLSNANVKHARALAQQRKARERHQQFVVEGVRLITEIERAGIIPALLFCAPPFLRSALGQRLLQQWPRVVVPVSDDVLASISDTVTPQGVAAIVPMPRLAPTKRDLLLVVDNVRDPGNLGTLLRSAWAAGVDEVLISAGNVDVFSPKVVRAAMGAHFRLPLQPDLTWADISARVASLTVRLADAAGAADYARCDWRAPAALIVGGEAEGASAAARAAATEHIRIPMQRETESLNAAIAGSIILFEAARQRRLRL